MKHILKIVEETFDEEISSSCSETLLGLTSWIDGKEEFMKRLAERLAEVEELKSDKDKMQDILSY